MTPERIPVVFAADHGRTEPAEVLPEGTRIRSKLVPELTGVIKHWEYNRPGVLSPIPYCIGWDDSSRAHEALGFLFVYASDDSVEPVPETG